MTITFESDSDVTVYALEKTISFARVNQYLFVANCAWWIAGIIGLHSGLIIFIDNLRSRQPIVSGEKANNQCAILSTPRDIARRVSPEDKPSDYNSNVLRRTRQGRINPLPQTKRQLKKARHAEKWRKANA
jgi:hypothetical protein